MEQLMEDAMVLRKGITMDWMKGNESEVNLDLHSDIEKVFLKALKLDGTMGALMVDLSVLLMVFP